MHYPTQSSEQSCEIDTINFPIFRKTENKKGGDRHWKCVLTVLEAERRQNGRKKRKSSIIAVTTCGFSEYPSPVQSSNSSQRKKQSHSLRNHGKWFAVPSDHISCYSVSISISKSRIFYHHYKVYLNLTMNTSILTEVVHILLRSMELLEAEKASYPFLDPQ